MRTKEHQEHVLSKDLSLSQRLHSSSMLSVKYVHSGKQHFITDQIMFGV